MRVSGLGVWGAQIKPEITLPPWWTIVPPREETLAGMVARPAPCLRRIFLRGPCPLTAGGEADWVQLGFLSEEPASPIVFGNFY